jgi:thiosulfate reductase cytochrome b subunit
MPIRRRHLFRVLPMLALAAAPARAREGGLVVICDTTLAPAMRKVGAAFKANSGVPVFVFTTGPPPTLPQLLRDIDVEFALARHGDPCIATATAIAWHLAVMWLLAVSYILFLLLGALSGHFWRDFLPRCPRSIARDFIGALRFRLEHRLGEYNAVQKAACRGVLAAVAVMIVSGIAIWKPVQTYPFERLLAGFQGARLAHFIGMTGIVLFLIVYVAFSLLVARTLDAMVLGRAVAQQDTR